MSRKTNVTRAVDKHVGNRIRWYRIHRGLSQQELADKLKISYQQLHKYENGSNSASASRLAEIALLLAMNVEQFFEGFEGADALSDAEQAEMTREQLTLMKYISQIREPGKREALSTLLRSLGAEDPEAEDEQIQ